MSSLPADRKDPDEPQTSSVRITVESPAVAAVTACIGAASDMIRAHKINKVIFLIVVKS
ncbi:MAG: hypothetical protein OEW04_12115 [Nitrospirota bacterium]|nr:hypothetical protein [Nitrospirota bacterium]